MSFINRDKARFHNKRKAGITRRARNRERLQSTNRGNTSLLASEKKGASA